MAKSGSKKKSGSSRLKNSTAAKQRNPKYIRSLGATRNTPSPF